MVIESTLGDYSYLMGDVSTTYVTIISFCNIA